jgi:hypothetical protein
MRQACEESVGKAGWFMVGSEMAEIEKEHARSLSGMLSRKSGLLKIPHPQKGSNLLQACALHHGSAGLTAVN